MKHKVTKRFGQFKVGQIVDDKDIYIRRKIQEGGCTEPFEAKESKMVKNNYENKMVKNDYENKEDKKGGEK